MIFANNILITGGTFVNGEGLELKRCVHCTFQIVDPEGCNSSPSWLCRVLRVYSCRYPHRSRRAGCRSYYQDGDKIHKQEIFYSINGRRRSYLRPQFGVFCCLKFQGTYILRMPFKQLEKQSAEGAKHFSKRSSIRRVPLAVWKVVCVAWTKANKLGKRKSG